MDTESPVVWPAWCYTGDAPDTPATPPPKRRRHHHHHNHHNNHHHHRSTTLDFANNNTSTTNNNTVKSERLSPHTPDNASSRSATPSSASPPSNIINHHQQSLGAATGADAALLSVGMRNYSDFMRSLAAKYHQQNDLYRYFTRSSLPTTLRTTNNNATTASAYNNHASSLDAKSTAATTTTPTLNPLLINPFAHQPPLIDMSATQTLLTLVRNIKEQELQNLLKNVGSGSGSSVKKTTPQSHDNISLSSSAAQSPLDLSSSMHQASPSAAKKTKRAVEGGDDVTTWSVDAVCDFVQGIDICAEYAQTFREQRIDGSGLPLLTEDHLTSTMGMKLGPALKLRSILAKRLGTSCTICLHCAHCHSETQTTPPAVSVNTTTTTTSTPPSPPPPPPSSVVESSKPE